MTLKEFKDLLKTTEETAVKIMLKDGYHDPMLHVLGSNSTGILPLMIPEQMDKQKAFHLMGKVLKKDYKEKLGNLLAVIHISEGWMAKPKKAEEKFVQPSLDPQRKEVLIIASYFIADAKTFMTTYKIKRENKDETSKIIRLTKEKDIAKGSMRSYLLESFIQGFSGTFDTSLKVRN